MKTHAEMILISMGRSTANVILTESTPLRCCGRGRTEAFESVPGIAPAVAAAFQNSAFWTRGSSTPVHSGAAGLPCGNGRLLVCLFHQKSSVWTDARWFGHKCPALASRGARPFFSAVDRHVAVPLTSIQSVWRTSICVFFSVHLYLVLHCSSVSL